MKIALLPYCFYPDGPGGTEIYVEGLASHLAALGWPVAILAPSSNGREDTFLRSGVRIIKYRVPASRRTEEIYSNSCPEAGKWFGKWLAKERPDVIHFHALTRAHPVEMFSAAEDARIPVMVTYHTPAVSCARGTLLLWGKYPCDGFMDSKRCSACVLHGKAIPKLMACALGALPLNISKFFSKALPPKLKTVFGMRSYVYEKIKAVQKCFRIARRITVPCDWARQVLLKNGIPEEKIFICRQGAVLDGNGPAHGPGIPVIKDQGLIIGYIGRLDEAKGVHTLIEAVKMLPKSYKIRCAIYGITQGHSDERYARKLRGLAGNEARIFFNGPRPHEDICNILKSMDLLTVPSICMETGPLVILEAFAAKVPVMGSSLGGISELVRTGVDGLLVRPGSAKAWCSELRRIYEDGGMLSRLRGGIRAPYSMRSSAEAMRSQYIKLSAAS